MIIPMVSSLSEDVLSAVPRGSARRVTGWGRPSSRSSTRIVLPAGLSGVISSFILAISRAIGETMAVVLAAGSRPQITLNPLTSIETMTAYIVGVASGEAAEGSAEALSLFAVGMALFLITLVLNLLSGLRLAPLSRDLPMTARGRFPRLRAGRRSRRVLGPLFGAGLPAGDLERGGRPRGPAGRGGRGGPSGVARRVDRRRCSGT